MMYIKNTSTPTSLDKFFILIQSFFLIFSLLSLSSFAQVVIEERVEIGGTTSKDNLKKSSSIIYKDDIPSGFIMPKSGMLQVFYGYLTHYDGPMPWYSTLNTYFFKDDSTRTDQLTPRFTDYLYWQRNFPFCNPSTRWEWNYFPEEEYLYNVDRVTEGDTIQFTYFSDWVASQDTFTYGVYSAIEIWVDSQLVGWDMLFGNYDWCMEEFDNVLYISVGVIEWDNLHVEVIPDTIYPGDSALVVIKKMLPDSTLVDFDSTQTYEVGMLEGCILGKIVAGTEEGSHLTNVLQPIYFVADTSADSTGTVLLRVGLVESDKTARQNKKILQTDILESDCFFGWGAESYKEVSVVKDNPLKIIYPKSNTKQWITTEPQMPDNHCSAIFLKSHSGVIKYEWKFIVKKTYERRWGATCVRISKSEFQGISYSDLIHLTTWDVPFDKDSGYFYFKSVQHFQDPYNPKEYYGCDGDVDEWYDETSNEIFTGGDVYITLTAKDYQTGEILARLEDFPSGKILGLNPDTQTIYSYANSNKIKAIMQIESKEYHFIEEGYNLSWWPYNEVGWPIYGPPNGFGLMQLDNTPAATESQLWNWKANVDGGKQKLNNIETAVDKYILKKGATNEEKYRLTNAFHDYHIGNYTYYYIWKERKWKVNPNRGYDNDEKSEYGNDVYIKYLELGGGN